MKIFNTKIALFLLFFAISATSFAANREKEVEKLKKGQYFVVQMVTSKGEIDIKLLNSTPRHRDNFVKLIREDFYNGIFFHRFYEDFMIQGGDITTRDSLAKAPDYTLDNEIDKTVPHYRGALAAAREGDDVNPEKKSCATEFYICQCKVTDKFKARVAQYVLSGRITKDVATEYLKRGGVPHLDGNYTVYGYTLKGIEVVDAIAKCKHNDDGYPDKPSEVTIESVKVVKMTDKKINKLYKDGK